MVYLVGDHSELGDWNQEGGCREDESVALLLDEASGGVSSWSGQMSALERPIKCKMRLITHFALEIC